ncbi:hypothetical protein ACFSC6_14215 [Rufibacter sediminis]
MILLVTFLIQEKSDKRGQTATAILRLGKTEIESIGGQVISRCKHPPSSLQRGNLCLREVDMIFEENTNNGGRAVSSTIKLCFEAILRKTAPKQLSYLNPEKSAAE